MAKPQSLGYTLFGIFNHGSIIIIIFGNQNDMIKNVKNEIIILIYELSDKIDELMSDNIKEDKAYTW